MSLYKRLYNEYNYLKNNPLPNILVSLNPNEIFQWEIIILPPENTPYDGIIFNFKINFLNSNYPFKFPYIDFPEGFCNCFLSDEIYKWSPYKKLKDILNYIYNFFEHPIANNCFTTQLNAYFEKNKNKTLKENYIFLDALEKGDICSVYKVKDKKTNEIKVIKIINKNELKKKLKEIYDNNINILEKEYQNWINDLYDEGLIMKILNFNDNSVKYYDNFHDKNEFCFIKELCDENLTSFLKKKNNLNKKEIYNILYQLNSILKTMEEKNIIHRNIKPQNIFIKYDDNKKKYIVKLTNYKVSSRFKTLRKKSKNYQDYCLTMAPEVLRGGDYDNKSDLWSLGVLIYLLVFNQYPFLLNENNQDEILNQIDSNEQQKLLKKSEDEDLNNLIFSLLEKDPSKRLDWTQYFNHSFFTNNMNLISNNEKKCIII